MPTMAPASRAANQKAIHVFAENITLVPAVRMVSFSCYVEFRLHLHVRIGMVPFATFPYVHR